VKRSQQVASVKREITKPKEAVIRWLLDSDPSIRWQVKRDLIGEPEEVVAAERSRVALEGWGARLLSLQERDGNWGGGAWVYQSWASTMETLMLLRELGLDPASEQARNAIGLVRDKSTWGPHHNDSPFFEGEAEPCINGRVLACGAYFAEASDRLVDRLLSEQLEDGGWNCDAPPSKRSSFNSTICVLEGLLEYEKARVGPSTVRDARLRGQEYLLERRLFRSLSTGKIIDRDRKDHRCVGHDSRFRLVGITTSCGAWTTCERLASGPMGGPTKQSTWWQGVDTRTADGRSLSPMRARSTSTWKVRQARRAAGTRSVLCVCWTGIQHKVDAGATKGLRPRGAGA
jgi:hypothetical protein